MKKILSLAILINFIMVFSQKINFNPSIKIEYDARLKLGEKYQHSQKFILIGNSRDYYFAAGQNYLNDTGQYEPKGVDTKAISDYFQERLIRKDGKTNIFITIIDTKIKYEENVALKWVLYGSTKIINGVKCQMAATNKFGRRWIAYFSKEYPQSLGPYKFTGLPGVIFELYDTRDDYHFTLAKIENSKNDFDFNLSGYKNYSKDKYLKAKYNMEFTLAAFPPIDDADFRKQTQNILERKKKMYNNPLELKPFE